MKIQIKLDRQAIKKIENAARKSAVETMEELQRDLKDSETMPFDNGIMQNNQTFVKLNESGVSLITGSPQAIRLYYRRDEQRKADFYSGSVRTADSLQYAALPVSDESDEYDE